MLPVWQGYRSHTTHSMKIQHIVLYGTRTNITTGVGATHCFVVAHNKSQILSRSLLQLLSRRRPALCSLTASGLDHYVITLFLADFHGFRGYRALGNILTGLERVQTFPNVVRESQQSFRTIQNTPMGVDRQNPPHLDFRQNRPAVTTHDHQRSTCSAGTRNSAAVYSQTGRGTALCAIL